MNDKNDKKPRKIWEIPAGDDKHRLVCHDCGDISYDNPKIITGSVVTYGDKILLCRRAIDPRKGYWNLPGGFMENSETVREGSIREAWEEACAKIRTGPLIAVFDLPHISQVHLIYRSELLVPDIAAGTESLEVAFFEWNKIPWNELAFPVTHKALHAYHDTKHLNNFQPVQEKIKPMKASQFKL